MALFGGFKGRNPLDRKFTDHEAAHGILLSVIASDGDIGDEEVDTINLIVNRHPIFRTQSAADHKRMVDEQLSILRKQGVDVLSEKAAGDLPERLRATVFALAVDFVLADGQVDQAEERLIEKLRSQLGIGLEDAEAVVGVLSQKNGIG